MKIDFKATLAKLPLPANAKWPEGVWDVEAFARGGLSLSLFAPRKHDYQNPHGQDELYLIVSGHGEFQFEQQQTPFSAGDVIFVAADRPHRFVKFSEDFVAWVVFWGPPREQP